ncbi:hypothetical protein M406DRAFT_72357 [Cryphonectria parasitica EP155]|uniref:Uncharacterized protein n=1 Tax=Cryphonectria parasitica (strain ATCC 38755 / EP155) TaxID=660469 RepID=A0A9P4XWR0_CRYP1|nr:uncharacterized protein M406DRAFT_72357 [Cryphonectria parasitica EP155]KAF3762344.1 hypothetical protein M406DRAFT_72357 [Cryphonectria parasitica EP155]
MCLLLWVSVELTTVTTTITPTTSSTPQTAPLSSTVTTTANLALSTTPTTLTTIPSTTSSANPSSYISSSSAAAGAPTPTVTPGNNDNNTSVFPTTLVAVSLTGSAILNLFVALALYILWRNGKISMVGDEEATRTRKNRLVATMPNGYLPQQKQQQQGSRRQLNVNKPCPPLPSQPNGRSVADRHSDRYHSYQYHLLDHSSECSSLRSSSLSLSRQKPCTETRKNCPSPSSQADIESGR